MYSEYDREKWDKIRIIGEKKIEIFVSAHIIYSIVVVQIIDNITSRYSVMLSVSTILLLAKIVLS